MKYIGYLHRQSLSTCIRTYHDENRFPTDLSDSKVVHTHCQYHHTCVLSRVSEERKREGGRSKRRGVEGKEDREGKEARRERKERGKE